jgi:hypothetical protein
MWEVFAKPIALVEAQTLHGPALKRSRFDVSKAPIPEVRGGMSPELCDEFVRHAQLLDKNPPLPSRLDRIIHGLFRSGTMVGESLYSGSRPWCPGGLLSITRDFWQRVVRP